MNTEAHEVSAPESASNPTHAMSPAGQARLAALEANVVTKPDELNVSAGTPTEVTDADGGKANLEDGTFTPPARPDPEQPKPERTISPEPLEAIQPLAVSDKYREVAEAYREDLAAIAHDHPSLAPSELNHMYQFAGAAAAAEFANDEANAELSTGQTAGASLRNPDETRNRIMTRYGQTAGSAIIAACAKEFASLPTSVKKWLDAPDEYGNRLGNNPQVVVALALRQYARLSPEAAAKEMGQLRVSAAYQSGDKLAISKMHMLTLVAAGSPQQQERDRYREGGRTPKQFGTMSTEDAPARVGHQTAEQMRAEMRKLSLDLVDTRGDLAKNPKRRAAALQRRAQLMAQLGGAQ